MARGVARSCQGRRYYLPHALVTRALGRMTHQGVDRTLQKGLVPTYAFGVLVGVFQIIYTPAAMRETIGNTGANALGVLMLVGASLCLAGVLVPRGAVGDWFGEYAGLGAVVASVLAWAGVVLKAADTDPGRMAPGFALLMLASLLVVRWWRVKDDARRSYAEHTTPPPTSSAE